MHMMMFSCPAWKYPGRGTSLLGWLKDNMPLGARKYRRSWKTRLNYQWESSLLLQLCCAYRDPRVPFNLWHAKDVALHRAQILQRPWASNGFLSKKLVDAGNVQRGGEPQWPVHRVLGNVAWSAGTCLSAVRPGHEMGMVLGSGQQWVTSCSTLCSSACCPLLEALPGGTWSCRASGVNKDH